jgi:dephospho-CoA kinase
LNEAKKVNKQLLIGITGGPGVGKTEAAKILERHGVFVISADKIGHQILENNRRIRREIQAMFGDSTFDTNGKPNRKLIGEKVFANQKLLTDFNSLIHPLLLRIVKKELNKAAKSGKKLVAVDAALIYEWGIANWFDILVVVDANRENRLRRLAKNGLSRSRAAQRISLQMPQKDKKDLADFVVVNNGNLLNLKDKIGKLVKLLKGLPLMP